MTNSSRSARYVQNQRRWNEVASLHATSEFYRAGRVIRGEAHLSSLETRALGKVTDSECLHLMRHIGTDTIMLRRLCKRTVGADYSNASITIARSFATRAGLTNVDFIVADVAMLPLADCSFEVVFLNWGSLIWLFDPSAAFAEFRRVLRPGGRLVIIDQHPVSLSVEHELRQTEPMRRSSGYLNCRIITQERLDYADKTASIVNREVHEARHDLGSIIRAIVRNFRLKEYEESDCLGWPGFPEMERVEDRLWRLPQAPIPMSFSSVAVVVNG